MMFLPEKKIAKYIWVIGLPRSGTTFLTDYIGQYVDYCYNEPFKQYPLAHIHNWEFPACSSQVLKFCENWQHGEFLSHKFKKSYFVHIIRSPKQAVYSIARPKKDSKPYRDIYQHYDDEKKFHKAANRWREEVLGCINCCKYYNGINVVYENIEKEIPRLAEFLDLPLQLDNFAFSNRNDVNVDVEQMEKLEQMWQKPEHKQKLVLRNKIEEMMRTGDFNEEELLAVTKKNKH